MSPAAQPAQPAAPRGLQRWLPRTLFGRLLLVLAGGLLVAQLLSAAINVAERDRLLSSSFGMQPAQRIADVVRLLDEPCACPLGGEWQTVELCGRARDCLAAADGRLLTPRDVDLALGDDGPDFWRLTQTARASYTLEVLGELGEAPQARLTTLLGAQAALRVVSVRRFSPERSLKFRQTLSELGSPLSVGG